MVDLPIDHFRLLGVSPSSDAQAILRKLQSRCDHPPDQGFTHEVLQQRQVLLQRSADLLTDQERREEYEAALLQLSETHPDGTVGLDLASSSEVAGLILLWEARASHEAFQLARQGLQPPQAPALGSGREADLTLLAALACCDAAAEDRELRRYEVAAGLLQEGIELQQRMGKLPDQQAKLEQALQALHPYRVLDLLSRDLSDQQAHLRGLALLNQLVSERGGLEGEAADAGTAQLAQSDFETFFQQIRRFLTVQEQIDLFGSWYEQGSEEAGCLVVFALTAAGFTRRKPELLEQAREQLVLLKTPDLDPMPLHGCIDLLLGDVAEAALRFGSLRDPDLKDWFADHPGDELAAQCDYCRVWLERDVLPGYRDVEPAGVDLDAWFADRDVQAYVDRLDRLAARQEESPTGSGMPDWLPLLDRPVSEEPEEDSVPAGEPESARLAWTRQLPLGAMSRIAGAVVAALVTALVVQALMRQRTSSPRSEPTPIPVMPAEPQAEPSAPQATLKPEKGTVSARQPLTADQPTNDQLQALVQAWLDGKASALAGTGDPARDLAPIARERLVERVQAEQAADAAAGRSKLIEASVTAVGPVNRAPQRIAVGAQVAYADKTLGGDGQVLEQTEPGTLSLTYVFGRDGKEWKLHEYIPGR